MLHNINDQLYDLNKEARGPLPDSKLDVLYVDNSNDINVINAKLLNSVRSQAPLEKVVFSKEDIEDLEIIRFMHTSYYQLREEQRHRFIRLLLADIIEYYERLNLFARFDEDTFELVFDIPG